MKFREFGLILYSDLTDSRAELHEVWLLEELAERIQPGTVIYPTARRFQQGMVQHERLLRAAGPLRRAAAHWSPYARTVLDFRIEN